MVFEPPPDPLLNKVLEGKYCLVERIASGGMGVVYQAYHLADPATSLAVKMVHPVYAHNKGVCAALRREGKILARIQHPHVARLVDQGESSAGPYLVMPYYEGGDLSDVQTGRYGLRRPSLLELLEIGQQVCSAMTAVHAARFLHGDLKPENIFLQGWQDSQAAGCMQVILMDFGLAVPRIWRRALTRLRWMTGSLEGTPEYLAPEVLSSRGWSERSDIWSLGVVLYEALAQRRMPFRCPSLEGLTDYTKVVVASDPLPLQQRNSKVPPQLAQVIDTAIARDPRARHPSMAEFGARLKACGQEVAALEQSRASFLFALAQKH